VFITDKKSVKNEFGPLGEITPYLPRITGLRKNEKLNTIYSSPQGYGVIFLVNKTTGQYYTYEEALPMIRQIISDEQRAKNAQSYLTQLRELIVNGEDPDRILLFWGGWRRATNLSLDSYIPGIKESRLIIEDAARRNMGEISHVVKISDDEYTFYKVERKSRVSREDFHLERDYYRDFVVNSDYQKWLSEYRRRNIVKKY
jgi:hypothetical protein